MLPPPNGLAPKGLYTFDIEVIGIAPFYDQDRIRSKMLRIGECDVFMLLPKRISVMYVLHSARNANDAYIKVYDPLLQPIVGPVHNGTQATPENTSPNAWIWNDTWFDVSLLYAGEYAFTFWAQDNFPDYDKGHRRKWISSKYVYFVYPTVHFAFTENANYPWQPIDTTTYAQVAYDNLEVVFNPNFNPTYSLYRGWFPLGQPEQGGGGICIDKDAQSAVNTLTQNAIWEFEGHANSHSLAFNNNTQLTIDEVRSLNLNRIRLAVLGGCHTAGSPSIPKEQSIAQGFYDQGADAVIGFRDITSMSSSSFYFMCRFWYYLTKEGATVSQAAVWAAQDTIVEFPFLQPGQDILSYWVWGGFTVIPCRMGELIW